MVDEALIGTVIDEVTFPVERGKVLEFAKASHDANPAHIDDDAARAAGFDALPAPLTFTLVAMHWRERDDDAMAEGLGIDLQRSLHGEVGWEYLKPVIVGDVLHGVRRLTDVTVKEGKRGGSMTLVTLETEWTNQRGETVIRQHDKLIEMAAQA